MYLFEAEGILKRANQGEPGRIKGEKKRNKDKKNYFLTPSFLFHFSQKWNKTLKSIWC